MSLKSQLLGWFLAFSSIAIFTIFPINIYYFNKKEEISESVRYLDSFYLDLLRTLLTQADFLSYETRSTRFFSTNKSNFLDTLRARQNNLNVEIAKLVRISERNNFEATSLLEEIQAELKANNQLFEKMVNAIYRRGFKDWGTEGQMRDNVHLLENFEEIDQRKVLSLRRHEKDYIIRNDSAYVIKLNTLADGMRKEVASSRNIPKSTRETILDILNNYQTLFNKLVALDVEIGIKSRAGLHLELLEKSKTIESLLEKIRVQMNYKKDLLMREIEFVYVLASILLILISFVISWFISRKITKPIQALSASIKQLVQQKFETKVQIKLKKPQREIKILSNEFNKMIEQLHLREKEREIAKNELYQSELKYRELADMLPQSVFEINQAGELTYINQALKKNFGYTDDDIRAGIKLDEIIRKKQEQQVELNASAETHEIIAIRKDQSHFHGLFYINPIIYKGVTIGQRGLIIDISERQEYMNELKKEKAKAEESDKLKSSFLANMSHEIRTPMNAIIGFSEILKDPDLNYEERCEFISYINTNGETLLNLIEDIIDIAKIESGHISINKSPTHLNNLLNELESSINEIRKLNHKEEVVLINDSGNHSQKDIILTDPLRLRQVLINLLTNAVKFTENGHIRFGYHVNIDQSEIIFHVEDTGIGIPDDKKEIIFERFRKVYDLKNKHYRGTGLGLYISKTIINLLGGEIWLESSIDKGSIFYFTIPYHPILDCRSEEIIAPTSSDIDISNIKILVAEDQEFNYLLLKTILEKLGPEILWVKNGIEVLDFFLDDKDADIILMDINMPEMDGYEAIRQIKKMRPQIPIIVQTANAMVGEREKCLEIGADEYIAKPINKDEIILKIAQLTKQKQAKLKA